MKKKESKFKYIMYSFTYDNSICKYTFLYKMYLNINVENNQIPSGSENTAIRLAANQEETKEDITDILEKITKCVVGISKIKK